MAGCSKCGNGTGCGCKDTALVTVPTVPLPNCTNPEPCSELTSSDCVVYPGPATGLPCDINPDDRLTVVIQKMLACLGGAGGAAWLLSGNALSGPDPESPVEFIGTLNLYDYIMRVNNIEAFRLNTNLTMNSPWFSATPVFAEPVKNGDWWFEDVAGVTYLVRVNSLGVTQKVQMT